VATQTIWFIVITVLWAGFFVLEGFDFGVGMLVPILGRDETERRMLRRTIGPVWDGNEVWLITAGGATFAAFPDWYATMFSAYYLPLFVILVALILRACASEYRDKASSEARRRAWDVLMAGSCLVAPLLIGVALGGLLGGLPIDSAKEFTGGLGDLVQPFALFTGITFVVLCVLQGLTFIRLRTDGPLEQRAAAIDRVAGVAAVVALTGFMVWAQIEADAGLIPNAGPWLALTFAGAAAWLAWFPGHRGWGFACSSLAVVFTVFGYFGTLYPDVMVSSTSPSFNLTITDSSSSYTLTLMTIVALVMLPVVVGYQAWTYRVFRRRVTAADVGGGDAVAADADAGGDAA
jgi:cytochrome d ubiquinol oxidase subunit II